MPTIEAWPTREGTVFRVPKGFAGLEAGVVVQFPGTFDVDDGDVLQLMGQWWLVERVEARAARLVRRLGWLERFALRLCLGLGLVSSYE